MRPDQATAPQAITNGDTRQRILEAARSLFSEHGYSGTSVRLIARELGLSDPAVYYHFHSKQALYHALLDEPDYGPLPLDNLPLSRENVVVQILHIFTWWTDRPTFGRMLLREQLAAEEASIAFMLNSEASWHDCVGRPLRKLIGMQADEVASTISEMLSGLFWDALLSYDNHFSETVNQPFFQRRLRSMIELAIPETPSSDGPPHE